MEQSSSRQGVRSGQQERAVDRGFFVLFFYFEIDLLRFKNCVVLC